jgi:hypothetical protein
MRHFLGKLSRKTVVVGGIVLGVALLAALVLGACGTAVAAANTSTPQTTSTPTSQKTGIGKHVVRVVSVSGNTLTVTTVADKKAQQKTLTIGSATKIMTYGQPAKLSDIQANEWLLVRGSDAQHITQIDILGFGAQGTIQTLSSGGFTLLQSKHSGTGSVTINAGSSTLIQEGQLRLGLKDLQTGENVVVFGNQASGGALDARLVHVQLVSGQVTAINGSSITLTHGAKGTEVSVTTSAATKYYQAGQSVAASQLKVGDTIGVAGTVANKTSVTASAIFIREPHLAGKVLGVSGNTMTIETKSGVTWTVTVTGSTKYLKDGQPASLADIQPGSVIEVVGIDSGDQAMTALLIRIHAAK